MAAPSTPEPPDSSVRIEELLEGDDAVLDPAILEVMAERRARASAEPPRDELTRQAEAIASVNEFLLRSQKRKFDVIEDYVTYMLIAVGGIALSVRLLTTLATGDLVPTTLSH